MFKAVDKMEYQVLIEDANRLQPFLMSSSSHSRSVDCWPLMDFNLVALALLKGNLFNMSHIAL